MSLANGWIKCSDTMPEIDKIVLIPGGCAIWRGMHWDTVMYQLRAIEYDVEVWQPLPKPPKEK